MTDIFVIDDIFFAHIATIYINIYAYMKWYGYFRNRSFSLLDCDKCTQENTKNTFQFFCFDRFRY